MPRISISLPDIFNFSTNIPVRITDLNYGGHVGNDTILSLIHEARMQFLKHSGYTELNFAGTGTIMSDVSIEFKNEVFYGDVIKAYVTASDAGRASFNVYYKLVRVTASNETIVAIAKTGIVCYDYDMKKITAIPLEAKNILGL